MSSVKDVSEGNPYSDSKFQRFASSIERTLKDFEVIKDSQDLVTCLAKLHKVMKQKKIFPPFTHISYDEKFKHVCFCAFAYILFQESCVSTRASK